MLRRLLPLAALVVAVLVTVLVVPPGIAAHAAGLPRARSGAPAFPGSPGGSSAAGPRSGAPAAGWVAPLAGPLRVTRPFLAPSTPYGPGHRGVDLAGTPGEPVLAAGDGVVLFAGMVAGRPVVSIGHADGLRTTYEPVTPTVGAGQTVAKGAVLGSLLPGHPGCPVAACLHWGLLRGSTYLDPLALLRPPRIRLLPDG